MFIAPTRKRSKGTGLVERYRWTTPPAWDMLDAQDPTVEAFRDLVEQARSHSGTSTPSDTPHAAWDALDASQRGRVTRWLHSAVEGERARLAPLAHWPEGQTDDRGRGWEKRVADVAHRFGALARADWTPWTVEDGRVHFLDAVPDVMLAAVPDKWDAQHGRGNPAPWPAGLDADPLADLRTTSSRLAPQQQADGGDAQDGVDDGPAPQQDDGEDGDDGPRRSIAAVLVDLALERYRFAATPDGEPFAVPLPGSAQGQGHVVRLLRGGRKSLRAELASVYRARTGRVASQQALVDAVRTLEGESQAAEPEALHVRVAERHGAIYVDMGDTLERVVRVAAGRWDVIESGVPVLFRQSALTGAIPTPVAGGDLDRLWDLVNVAPQDRPLVLAWLAAAIVRPNVPHPVMALFGEQGSGKSSASRALVKLVDPGPVPLRKPPRDQDSWVTAASGSWVVGLDNLSAVPDWLSDSLCRAVTGEGDVRRVLYSDSDLHVFAFRRVILVNGIDLGAVRGDLADRLVAVDLDRITETTRLTETDLDAEWARVYPHVLGGLLDLAADLTTVLPTIRLDSAPRMADFAQVLAAVDQLRGTTGLDRLAERALTMAEDSVAGDAFLAAMGTALADGAEFVGTAAQLLAHVVPDVDGWKRPVDWPKSAQVVSGRLKRNAPALRKSGWTVDNDGANNKRGVTTWRLTPPPGHEMARESSPPSPLPRSRRSQPHGGAGMAESASPPLPATSLPSTTASPAASLPLPAIPATGEPLTSEDREERMAGRDYGPSLARDLTRCPDCGNPIHSLAGGVCVPCSLKRESGAE